MIHDGLAYTTSPAAELKPFTLADLERMAKELEAEFGPLPKLDLFRWPDFSQPVFEMPGPNDRYLAWRRIAPEIVRSPGLYVELIDTRPTRREMLQHRQQRAIGEALYALSVERLGAYRYWCGRVRHLSKRLRAT